MRMADNAYSVPAITVVPDFYCCGWWRANCEVWPHCELSVVQYRACRFISQSDSKIFLTKFYPDVRSWYRVQIGVIGKGVLSATVVSKYTYLRLFVCKYTNVNGTYEQADSDGFKMTEVFAWQDPFKRYSKRGNERHLQRTTAFVAVICVNISKYCFLMLLYYWEMKSVMWDPYSCREA